MFFKRLSRGSRSNSYVDESYDDVSPNSPSANAKFDRYDARPENRRQPQSQHNVHSKQNLPSPVSPPGSAGNMWHTQHPDPYASQAMPGSRGVSGTHMPNGMGHSAMPLDGPAIVPSLPSKVEPAPDLLTRAFNEAVRPYTDKIEQLETDLQDMRAYVESLENERRDVHAWIDKRGLRPGMLTSQPPPTDHHSLTQLNRRP